MRFSSKNLYSQRLAVALLALLFILSVASLPGSAQTTTTGSVVGVITDPGGAVVPAAKVSLLNSST